MATHGLNAYEIRFLQKTLKRCGVQGVLRQIRDICERTAEDGVKMTVASQLIWLETADALDTAARKSEGI